MRYNFILLIILILILVSFSSAKIDFTKQDAEVCLNNSERIISDFVSNNYSYYRLNDSFRQAKFIFEAQSKSLKLQDFSYVKGYCDEIENISELSFDSRISFLALKNFYNLSLTSDMNTSNVDNLFYEIQKEIDNERYELVPSLINKGYILVIDTKSQNNAINLFYDSTKSGFSSFFEKYGKFILILVVLVLLFVLIYRTAITRYFINNKLANLERRKESIKELIKKTQKEYFQDNSISEVTYNVRVNTYGDMVRDIDRQIPLLKESLIKTIKNKETEK